MSEIWEQVSGFFWNILHRPTWVDFVDIIIIAFLIYQLVLLTRRTRSIQVIKGLAILIVASYVSELAGLTTLHWVLRSILDNGVIVLLILFQPELKRALEQLGRTTKLEMSGDQDESERIVHEIASCCMRLSARKVGALIVFERKTGLKEYMETGTAVDAVISAPLLENIFEPNTPLHDGAVIIVGQRVASAACVLCLSQNPAISRDLGTRHRAGIGISETTDAIALIVSEETGVISYTSDGEITRGLDAETLPQLLRSLYHENHSRVWRFFHRQHTPKAKAASSGEE